MCCADTHLGTVMPHLIHKRFARCIISHPENPLPRIPRMADPRARPAPSDSPPLAGAVRSAVPRDSGGTPRDDASPPTLSGDVTTDGDDGDDAATHYRAASAAGGGMLQRRRRGGLSGVVGRRERVGPPAEGGRRTCSELLREYEVCALRSD